MSPSELSQTEAGLGSSCGAQGGHTKDSPRAEGNRERAVLLHSREEHGRNLKQGRCNGEMWLLIKHLEFSASGATQNIHLDFLLMLSSKFQIH